MLKITDKGILSDLRNETITVEQLSFHLMRHYSVADIADSLAECLIDLYQKEGVQKIRITEEQLKKYFKVIGFKDYLPDSTNDGLIVFGNDSSNNEVVIKREKRGRPKKDVPKTI